MSTLKIFYFYLFMCYISTPGYSIIAKYIPYMNSQQRNFVWGWWLVKFAYLAIPTAQTENRKM